MRTRLERWVISISTVLTAAIGILVFSRPAAAQEFYRFEGGIKGDKEYAEVLFITGEPVVVTGTVRETVGRGRGNLTTGSVTFTLENKDKGIKLSRSLSYSVESETAGRQEVASIRVERFSESITVGKDRYTLKEFQFSRSELLDHQPAVLYKSGNWTARKVYSVNNDLAKVIVETWGHNVGYQHAWGNTESAREEGTVFFSGQVAVDKKTYVSSEWSASFRRDLSYHRLRYLEYQENEPVSISFPGGYVENTQTVETMYYSGSFPDLLEGQVQSDRWQTQEGSYELKAVPAKRWLPVAKWRDVRGHWAEADILKLYGLGALEAGGDYFYPALPFYRGQFARALAQVLDLPLPEEAPSGTRTGGLRRNQVPQEKPLFADVAVTDPAYKYYKAVYEAGIMSGTGVGVFGAAEPLTRAQALVILVRALGLETLAPAKPPSTAFLDDWTIPAWARPAIYVAYKIGLARGDEYGYLRPNEVLTRAEAAAFLNRFIRYLQEEMTADYRERVLNF